MNKNKQSSQKNAVGFVYSYFYEGRFKDEDQSGAGLYKKLTIIRLGSIIAERI